MINAIGEIGNLISLSSDEYSRWTPASATGERGVLGPADKLK